MNKQELIDELKKLLVIPSEVQGHNYGLRRAIALTKQLDEPEKPVVPQFVADWIEYCKSNELTLLGALDPVSEYGTGLANTFTGEVRKGVDWAKRNQDIFARAWLFGYEVEKEKLYLASFRDTDQYLGWNEKLGEWFMSCSPFTSGVEQTQATWEGVGIWNNQAFEIKEVEE